MVCCRRLLVRMTHWRKVFWFGKKALQAMPDNLANLPRSQLYLKPFNGRRKPAGAIYPEQSRTGSP